MKGEETHPALCADQLLWRREGTKLSTKLLHHGGFIGDSIGDASDNARSGEDETAASRTEVWCTSAIVQLRGKQAAH